MTKTIGRSILVAESTRDALLNPPHDLSFVGELDAREGVEDQDLDPETLVHVGRFAVVAALISRLPAACGGGDSGEEPAAPGAEGRLTTAPSGCCVRKEPLRALRLHTGAFPVEAAPRVPQHPPDECPMRGRQPGQHTTPAFTRASAPAANSCAPALGRAAKGTAQAAALDWSSSDMRPRQCPPAAELDEAGQRDSRVTGLRPLALGLRSGSGGQAASS